jgi:hypothetical protein
MAHRQGMGKLVGSRERPTREASERRQRIDFDGQCGDTLYPSIRTRLRRWTRDGRLPVQEIRYGISLKRMQSVRPQIIERWE